MPKTYQAETMMEALRMIQEELGSDAIVVSARELTKKSFWGGAHKAGVEVVAMRPLPGAAAGSAASKEPAGQKPSLLRPGQNGQVEFVEDETHIEWVNEAAPAAKPGWAPVHISRKEVEATRAQTAVKNTPEPVAAPAPVAAPQPGVRPVRKPALDEARPAAAPAGYSEALRRIRQQLLAQGVEEAFVDHLLQVAQDSYTPAVLENESVCRSYFGNLLQAEVSVMSGAMLIASKPVVCLVGSSGVGKSTTTARLAMLYAHTLGKKVTWICTDTLHTGAIGEARAYTDALGVPLKLAYTPTDLRQALDESQGSDLVLVDTGGFNPWNENQLLELGELLTVIPNRTTFLVASAATKESDLNQSAAALNIFHLDGMIITKLDETFSSGSVYNFARKSQIPLCYFTAGRLADGMLQAAEAERLVAALFGKEWNKA